MLHGRDDPSRLPSADPGADAQTNAKDSVPSSFSPFAHVELPIPRDRLLHLGVGASLLLLGLSATLAHAVARPEGPPALRPLAWLPLGYGVIAALTAFVLALQQRPGRWAYRVHGSAMFAGWAVGLAGALMHASASGRQGGGLATLFGSVSLAPLAFVAVSMVGWIAAWSDEALGVGRAPEAVARGFAPAVPGRRALLLVALAGFAALSITVSVDHGAGGWGWTEAVPVMAGLWSAVVVVAMLRETGDGRLRLAYVGTMLSNVLVGFAGLALHLSANMDGPPEELIVRMVRHAPLMAPLLFGLLGILGLLAVAEPAVDLETLEAAWPPRRRRR